MKKELSPAVIATVIIVIVIGAAFFVYRGVMTGPGSKAPGEVGNAGPFAPGGAANSKAEPARNGQPASHGSPGMPGAAR